MGEPLQELVKIQSLKIGIQSVNAVNARDLHEFLMIGRDFTNWIKDQIERGRFVESRDFEVFAEKGGNPSGGRPRTDYALTIDCAKHIAMLSNTDKGHEVREYFIECERQLVQPKQMSRLEMIDQMREMELARIESEKKALEFAQTIVEHQPKLELYHRIAESEESATGLRDMANMLGIKPKEFNDFLIEKKWIYRCPSTNTLKPMGTKLKSNSLEYKYVMCSDDRERQCVIFTSKGIIEVTRLSSSIVKPKEESYTIEELVEISSINAAQRYINQQRRGD